MSTGQIFIELTQPFFFAGDTVTGHIYLNLNESFDGANIKLKLKGWESTYWISTHPVQQNPQQPFRPDSDDMLSASDLEISQSSTDSSDCKDRPKKGYLKRRNGQYTKVVHHVGGKEFMKKVIPLEQFGNGFVNSGQYKLPFSFVLNSQWPGTFSHKQEKAKGRIKYEMRVKCEFPNDRKDREFKHTVELMVHEKPKSVKSEIIEMTSSVKNCCCIPLGDSKLKVFFDKNSFSIGDSANIICEIDNSQCKAKVNNVFFSLVQTSTFRDKQGAAHSIRTTIASKNFPGIEAGATCLGNEAKREQLQIEPSIKSRKKVITPTSTGDFVSSTYSLNVNCSMDAFCNCCCGGDPRVSLPVQVVPKQIIIPQFQQPPQWQPQIMPLCYVPMPGYHTPPPDLTFAQQ